MHMFYNKSMNSSVILICLSIGRMLIWLCWLWLLMKFIFQSCERFVFPFFKLALTCRQKLLGLLTLRFCNSSFSHLTPRIIAIFVGFFLITDRSMCVYICIAAFQIVYTPGQQDKCFLCGQMGHLAADCEGRAKRKAGEFDEKDDKSVVKKPYQVSFLYFSFGKITCNQKLVFL